MFLCCKSLPRICPRHVKRKKVSTTFSPTVCRKPSQNTSYVLVQDKPVRLSVGLHAKSQIARPTTHVRLNPTWMPRRPPVRYRFQFHVLHPRCKYPDRPLPVLREFFFALLSLKSTSFKGPWPATPPHSPPRLDWLDPDWQTPPGRVLCVCMRAFDPRASERAAPISASKPEQPLPVASFPQQ